jgi:quinol monooxygenase YgiN
MGSFLLLAILLLNACDKKKPEAKSASHEELMIRIAELEIDPAYLAEYLAILQKESEESIKLEAGVLVLYPMYQKEAPTQIRLLEVYANQAAYESHLKTPHFQVYKTSTLHMVKSLKLIEMEAIDPEMMPAIFTKLQLE